MSLPTSIECSECRDEIERRWPGRGSEPISRAAVNEMHWQHRPMHPNEVGAAHRKSAKAAYDAWEALSPYRGSP